MARSANTRCGLVTTAATSCPGPTWLLTLKEKRLLPGTPYEALLVCPSASRKVNSTWA